MAEEYDGCYCQSMDIFDTLINKVCNSSLKLQLFSCASLKLSEMQLNLLFVLSSSVVIEWILPKLSNAKKNRLLRSNKGPRYKRICQNHQIYQQLFVYYYCQQIQISVAGWLVYFNGNKSSDTSNTQQWLNFCPNQHILLSNSCAYWKMFAVQFCPISDLQKVNIIINQNHIQHFYSDGPC